MAPPPHSLVRGCTAVVLCALVFLASCGGGSGDRDSSKLARIETLAGGSTNLGDGGPATATFVNPWNVTVDDRGDVFIVDANFVLGHWLVRRVDARTGAITTVGGPCDPYVQADPPRTLCDLLSFTAIAVGGGGDALFVAAHDQRLFRVDTRTGELEHLAGLPALPLACKDDPSAPPLGRCLGFAAGIALDAAGNLYLGELGSLGQNRPEIRRLDPSFQHLDVVISDPAIEPIDVAIDRTNTLFVVNDHRKGIDAVDPTTGAVTAIAGSTLPCGDGLGDGGPATDACFRNPTGVAVRQDGTVFVADADRIRRIDPETRIIDTVVQRDSIERLAIAPDGDVIFTEVPRPRVSRLHLETRTVVPIAGNGSFSICGDGGPGNTACIGSPDGVAPAPDGSVYFADAGNQRIGRVDAIGRVTTVVDHDSAGSCGDTGPRRDFCLADPSALVRDHDGNLYFADRGTELDGDDDARPGRVRRRDASTGAITTIAGNCTIPGSTDAREACVVRPSSLLLDGHGGLYVGGQDGIFRIDLANGTIRHVVGGRGLAAECNADGIEAVDACVAGSDIALDAAGNLYVIAFDQIRVRRIDAATGIITTVAGNPAVFECTGEAEDVPATSTCIFPLAIVVNHGQLIIATAGKLRAVDLASGLIHTVPGFAAECGSVAPIPADCVYPWDLALDDHDRLVVAELASRSIRRITLP